MNSAIAAVQGWGKRRVVQPLTDAIRVFNWQAAHDQVKALVTENEAIQTALVTRILRLESRVRLLTIAAVGLAVAAVVAWFAR